jgi:hypothetical protein
MEAPSSKLHKKSQSHQSRHYFQLFYVWQASSIVLSEFIIQIVLHVLKNSAFPFIIIMEALY